jgi:hypothetical protein
MCIPRELEALARVPLPPFVERPSPVASLFVHILAQTIHEPVRHCRKQIAVQSDGSLRASHDASPTKVKA